LEIKCADSRGRPELQEEAGLGEQAARCAGQHESADPFRVGGGERDREESAHRVSDEVDLVNPEAVGVVEQRSKALNVVIAGSGRSLVRLSRFRTPDGP
jgi:hypothetical protein